MTVIQVDFQKQYHNDPQHYYTVEGVLQQIHHILVHTIDSEPNKYKLIEALVRELNMHTYQQAWLQGVLDSEEE